jgi:putative membrane protein
MRPPAEAQRAEPIAGPSASLRARRGRTLAAAAVGALLLALLVSYAGLGDVLGRLRVLGWGAPLVLVPYAIVNVLDTIGWRRALPAPAAARVPFAGLYLARMAGEAVNSLTPTAAVGGEPVKAHLLRSWGIPGSHGVASVVIAKTALTLSQVAFILVGLGALFLRLGEGLEGALLLAVLAAVSLLFAVLVVRLQRRGPLSTVWRWLRRVAPKAKLVARLEGKAQAVDERLADFYRIERSAFASATAWHFAAWMLGVCEIKVIMALIDTPIAWSDALIVEALAQPIRAVAVVIPGGLGAQEVGGVALCRLVGVPEAAAVTLWLLKRARELFFDAVGLLYLGRRTARRGRGAS